VYSTNLGLPNSAALQARLPESEKSLSGIIDLQERKRKRRPVSTLPARVQAKQEQKIHPKKKRTQEKHRKKPLKPLTYRKQKRPHYVQHCQQKEFNPAQAKEQTEIIKEQSHVGADSQSTSTADPAQAAIPAAKQGEESTGL